MTASRADTTPARGAQVLNHPHRNRSYDPARCNRLAWDQPLPEGVARLADVHVRRLSDMPPRTPELAILAAILASNDGIMDRAWATLLPAQDGRQGEAMRLAFNFVHSMRGVV